MVVMALAGLTVLAASIACSDGGPSRAERAAAARAAEEAAEAKEREESQARFEAQRLAALWLYQTGTMGGGAQVTAAIRSVDNVDTDGQGARSVQLVFRDHENWGRSSYLVLQAGDFACPSKCMVNVMADGGTPERLPAHRPNTDEAIAMFIDDPARLWRLAGDATRLDIEFPVKAGGTRTAGFEVSGLDESRMPGWSTSPTQ